MRRPAPQKPDRDFIVVLVAMLKGGTRKTTTAVMTAFELAAIGTDVLLVDADSGTQGVTEWISTIYAEGGEAPFDVVQWTQGLGLLVPFILKQQKESGAKVVIIDVGGEAPEVVQQAVKLADFVISPVGAEEAEIKRLSATKEVVAAAGKAMLVLLNRVPKVGGGAAREARAGIAAQGYTVLDTEVPQNRVLYSDVFGYIPEDTGAYADLVAELGLAR